MTLKFTAEDFQDVEPNVKTRLNKDYAALFAIRAQQKFDSWLESQPVVYNWLGIDPPYPWAYGKERDPDFDKRHYTHTARLVDIQEIKKEPCKHEAVANVHQRRGDETFSIFSSEAHCKHCGVRLVARWEEEK